MKAVFDVSPGSRYKDEIWRRYDIPNRPQVELVGNCVGDWIVFRRTGSTENAGYFAVARVESVQPDPERPTFFYARMHNYLAFPITVPLRIEGHYAETQLLSVSRPSQIGQFFQRNPIRILWEADFDCIVQKGFARLLHLGPSGDPGLNAFPGVAEESVEAWMGEPRLRRVDEVLRHIPFRDANFRLEVGRAYGHRCAFTGLNLDDGRGRYETQAAHFWSVADGGPDIVPNGICTNRTIHWALDPHLISIDENNTLMVARNEKLQAFLRINRTSGDFILLPRHPSHYPNPEWLARHRAAFLAKNRA